MCDTGVSGKGDLLPERRDVDRNFGYRCFDCEKELEGKIVYSSCYDWHDLTREDYERLNEFLAASYHKRMIRPEKCSHCESERITVYYKR